MWKKDQEWEITFPLRSSSGQYKWFLTRIVPIKDNEGKVYRWVGTNTDIDETVRIEQKLQEEEAKLKMVIRASELGTWEFDMGSNEVKYDERYLEILGYPAETILTQQQLESHVLPEDNELRILNLKQALITESLHYHYRIIRSDQAVRWVEGKGHIYYDEYRTPKRIIGTISDVTEEKEHRQELEEREEKFRSLAQSLPQLVWVTDHKGNQEFASFRWKQYSGINPGGEKEWREMVHPDDYEHINETWANSLVTGNVTPVT